MVDMKKHRIVSFPVGWLTGILFSLIFLQCWFLPQNAKTISWSLAGELDQPHDAHTATLIDDGRVLVAGGYDGTDVLRSAEIHDAFTRQQVLALSSGSGAWFSGLKLCDCS
jgi:hypothetical protein